MLEKRKIRLSIGSVIGILYDARVEIYEAYMNRCQYDIASKHKFHAALYLILIAMINIVNYKIKFKLETSLCINHLNIPSIIMLFLM